MLEITAIQALRRGVVAQKEGRIDDAERYYRAVIKAQINHPASNRDRDVIAEAHTNLGVALQQKGDLSAAIESYKQALKLKPDYTAVLYAMGLALRNKGDLKASVACYKKATEIKPDNADAWNYLGASLQHNGELDAAIESYKQALRINSGRIEVYNNLGSALQAIGDLDAAIHNYSRAIELKPDYPNAHNNLGHALHEKGDLEAAISHFKTALKTLPGHPETLNNLGNTLREAGDYQAALQCFDSVTTSETDPSKPQFWFNTTAQSLECLYILGRYSELENRIKLFSESNDVSLRVAAVSAFVSSQLKIEDRYPFCRNPLDFFKIGNLSSYVSDVDDFAENLLLEASKENQVWEPTHGVTKFGFQTSPTIFHAGKKSAALEKILRKEIDSYYAKFKSEDCVLINSWPKSYVLRGWFSRLLKGGFQSPHNHPSGWLSGVIYLKTVDPVDSDEGAIELSLHGHNLPILDHSYARKLHHPKKGDIILFPSSLFHRTIPFDQDTERCVIAFDLYRY